MPEIVVGRDDEDMRKYGTQGTLFIGKHLVGAGEDTHMTTPVLMDALRPHIIILTGKRGEGKCLLPNMEVLLSDGSCKNIEEIFINVKGSKPSEKEEFIIANKDTSVLSVNRTQNLSETCISNVYCKFINERVIEIKTNCILFMYPKPTFLTYRADGHLLIL